MDIIEEALWWAEVGVPVFPTGKDKRPLTANGHLDASTDPDTVVDMFENCGVALHGIGGAMGRESGLFAVDADVYKAGDAGESAQRFIRELRAAGMLPDTRTHETVSGGVHYIYKSKTGWPNTKPVAGVEVKGQGGYIILPPTEGYSVAREGVAEAPQSLLNRLEEARASRSATSTDNLKQAILRGDDFHDSLAQLAAKLSANGAPIEEVQAQLLNTLSASKAMVPTHPRHSRWVNLVEDASGELTRIVESANAKFNVANASTALVEAMGSRFREIVPQTQNIEDPEPVKPVKKAEDYAGDWPFTGRGYFGHEELNVLEQRFVMYPILSENEVTLISAAPKAGKTLVSQTLAMHIAAGMDLGGLSVFEKRPVMYFALESQVAIKKRLEAWKEFHDPEGTKFTEEDFRMYVSEAPLNLLAEETRADFAQKLKAAEQWFVDKGAEPLGAIVIDTLTKAMPGGDQNSVEDTSAVFDVIEKIKDAGIVAPVVIIHHNTKAGGQPRGSSNIQAEPDTLLTVDRDEETNQLFLRIIMARSIDDTEQFVFDTTSVDLGKTAQGYKITAPVLSPASVVRDSTAETATSNLVAAKHDKALVTALLRLGVGTWSRKRTHAYLKGELGETYTDGRQMRSNSTDYAGFIFQTIPPEGRTFEAAVYDSSLSGEYNIAATTELNRYGFTVVSGFKITDVTE